MGGALFLPAPWCFISLIGSNVFGEMWVGVTLAVVVELVPQAMRTFAVAIYLFVISNIGGNANVLIPPLEKAYNDNTWALFTLFTGLYLAGAVLFLLTLLLLRKDLERAASLNDDAESFGEDDGYGSPAGSPASARFCEKGRINH